MAITYVVGIPRSGKSYYVVYQLWKSFVFQPKDSVFTKFLSKFIKPKIPRHYNFAYTNINQFDFSKSSKFRKLDFDDLKIKLTELYNMYQDKKSDSELIEKAKEFDIYNVLFCIDEVHNFLGDKPDPVLVWWVTYHGHLYQDMILITQDLSLVNSKYKSNAEFFYRAVPPSKRLFTSKFRYTQYGNSRMAMNGKVGDFTIPALPDVFKMYVSGAENKSKSFVVKYLFIGFILLLILFVFIYIFISSFNSNTDKAVKKNIIIAPVTVPLLDKNISVSSYHSISSISLNDIAKKSDKDPITLFEINCISNSTFAHKFQ